MKTKIITTLTILATNLTFASSNKSFRTYLDKPVDNNFSSTLVNLAPVAPKEAYFTDIVPEPLVDISTLAPSTPKEATFEDEVNCGTIICNDLKKSLAPSSPKEAEFDTNVTPEPKMASGD